MAAAWGETSTLPAAVWAAGKRVAATFAAPPPVLEPVSFDSKAAGPEDVAGRDASAMRK